MDSLYTIQCIGTRDTIQCNNLYIGNRNWLRCKSSYEDLYNDGVTHGAVLMLFLCRMGLCFACQYLTSNSLGCGGDIDRSNMFHGILMLIMTIDCFLLCRMYKVKKLAPHQ